MSSRKRKAFSGKILIPLVMLFFLSAFPDFNGRFPLSAKDASPAASLTPIQQKLQDLKQEIASKAAEIKNEISQKISNKAYVGIITQITNSNQQNPSASASAIANAKLITITTSKGNRTIATNDYTVYQDSSASAKTKKTAVTVKNFSVGDFIAALGDVDDNLVLTAKKIIKTKPPQVDSIDSYWGQIQSVNPGSVLLVSRDNKKITLTLSSDTSIKVASDEATIKDVIPGNFLISIGSAPQNNRSVSDFIYLINPNGKLKIASASATASPSASPTASPSAKPKKK